MNREIIDLPCGLFGPLVSDWIFNVRGRAGNDSVSGNGQVVYGNAGRWEATLDLSGFGRERQLAWAAIRARMRGRVNLLRVCVCDRWRPKYSELGLSDEDIALIRAGIPHSDDTLFSDDTGYSYVPSVVTASEYAAGLDSITVDATSINGALQPGQWFSHDDWPYQVTGVEGDMDETTYYFEPPLRRVIPDGAEIIAGEATGIFAFQTDMEGRMARELGKHGNTQIQLVEWTNRPIS